MSDRRRHRLELGHWMLGTPNVGPMKEVFAKFARASGRPVAQHHSAMFTPASRLDELGEFFYGCVLSLHSSAA
jgi:hypothetical protein